MNVIIMPESILTHTRQSLKSEFEMKNIKLDILEGRNPPFHVLSVS